MCFIIPVYLFYKCIRVAASHFYTEQKVYCSIDTELCLPIDIWKHHMYWDGMWLGKECGPVGAPGQKTVPHVKANSRDSAVIQTWLKWFSRTSTAECSPWHLAAWHQVKGKSIEGTSRTPSSSRIFLLTCCTHKLATTTLKPGVCKYLNSILYYTKSGIRKEFNNTSNTS